MDGILRGEVIARFWNTTPEGRDLVRRLVREVQPWERAKARDELVTRARAALPTELGTWTAAERIHERMVDLAPALPEFIDLGGFDGLVAGVILCHGGVPTAKTVYRALRDS